MGDYCIKGNETLGLDMIGCGKKITQLLRAKGITDKELSEMMNVSLQAISKWRHGHNLPDPENMYILSRILGVKVDDLLVPRNKDTLMVIENNLATNEPAYMNRLLMYYRKLRELLVNHTLNDSPA